MDMTELHMQVLTKYAEKNPKDADAAVSLFNAFVARNDYDNMNKQSAKLANVLKQAQYAPVTVEALYMLSK